MKVATKAAAIENMDKLFFSVLHANNALNEHLDGWVDAWRSVELKDDSDDEWERFYSEVYYDVEVTAAIIVTIAGVEYRIQSWTMRDSHHSHIYSALEGLIDRETDYSWGYRVVGPIQTQYYVEQHDGCYRRVLTCQTTR
jgi:hypothetical protein